MKYLFGLSCCSVAIERLSIGILSTRLKQLESTGCLVGLFMDFMRMIGIVPVVEIAQKINPIKNYTDRSYLYFSI